MEEDKLKESKKVLTDYMLELNADIQSAEEWCNTGADEEMYFALQTVLDKLDRLQKKNERLIERNIKYDETLEKLQKETIWKFKIQNKVEELEKNKNKLDEINKTTRLYSPYDTYDFQINILEELLGDE